MCTHLYLREYRQTGMEFVINRVDQFDILQLNDEIIVHDIIILRYSNNVFKEFWFNIVKY